MQVDIDTPNGVSKALINGDLNLHQEEPTLIDSKKRTVYNTDLLDLVAEKIDSPQHVRTVPVS